MREEMAMYNEIERPGVPAQETVGPAEKNELAEVSFILGIVAALAIAVPFAGLVSPFAGVAAVACGITALSRADRAGGSGKALTGISLGSVALAASLVILFLLRHVLWRLLTESGSW
jgi:hypothetical protein